MRKRRLRFLVFLVLCVPGVLLGGNFATGLTAADFSGFDIASKATAVQWTFDSPSLGIPAKPTGELDLAHSESNLQSSSGYGLASVVWPGQVAAALPTFLQGEFQSQCQCEFPADLPNYPVRAESFHPQGPGSASTDLGTMHMRSNAKDSAAEGVAYLNKFAIPFVGRMGNQSSLAQSGFDQDGAVSMAEASVGDIWLLGGLIKIDSVVTRATARSDGVKGSVAGTTVVTGGEIDGVGKVQIDSTGVHIDDGDDIGAVAAQQALNQVLGQAGITMEVAPPIDSVQGPTATRALAGLIVRIKSDTFEPFIAALPADLQNQIRGQITMDQVVTLQFAPAAVKAGAAKTIEFPDVEPPAVGPESDTAPPPTSGETPIGEPDAAAPPTSGGSPVAAAPPITTVPVSGGFDGVPLWLVLLLMVASFVASRPLSALADRLLGARAGAGRCPLEE